VFDSLPADQRDPKQSLSASAELGLALAAEARRSGSGSAWSDARVALEHALAGWQGYQRGAGAAEDHHADIDTLSSALQEANRIRSPSLP
jgi:hypothetical protein